MRGGRARRAAYNRAADNNRDNTHNATSPGASAAAAAQRQARWTQDVDRGYSASAHVRYRTETGISPGVPMTSPSSGSPREE